MMKFQLKKVRNNVIKVFTLKSLLSMFADTINDEIVFDGERYRFSSLIDLSSSGSSGGGSGATFMSRSITVSFDNQTDFALDINLTNALNPQLLVNGIYYEYGVSKDFHFDASTVKWHSHFALETTDKVALIYYVL